MVVWYERLVRIIHICHPAFVLLFLYSIRSFNETPEQEQEAEAEAEEVEEEEEAITIPKKRSRIQRKQVVVEGQDEYDMVSNPFSINI